MNSTTNFGADIDALIERWWVPVLRGVAAILFGLFALAAPAMGLFALVITWGAYAIADGVLNLVLAARASRQGARPGRHVFVGIVSIAAGVLTFGYPGMTAFAWLFVIAAWAVLTGIVEIAAAIELRKVVRGEWMLAVAGVLSIGFGVLLVGFPGAGALAVVSMMGAYAIVFGALLCGLGVKLHRIGDRAFPAHGAPSST
jgi:uncharacterized membrane protein HdeD (DUF308 family)